MKYEFLSDKFGPVLITPIVHGDERGFFMETFRQNDFEKNCGKHIFVQDNHSKSRKGVLRGLHYQLNNPQGKLVRVISGAVFDVNVDLRKNSKSYGKYFSSILDDKNHSMLWVPPGFAHGFLVLSENAEFVYKCTEYYMPDDEYCLLWNDNDINIKWPLDNINPIISEKDKNGDNFKTCTKYEIL